MIVKKVLIDLSGTLHVENDVIPGAIASLKRLRESNICVKFVTNTSKESRKCLHQRLLSLGFDIKIDEIWTSVWAAREVIRVQKLDPFLIVDDAAMEDFSDLNLTSNKRENENHDAVVVGLAPRLFNYETLTKAFRFLISGAKLIAINEGRYHKTSQGLSLGPGCFVKGLEYAADCKARLIGKPNADFFMSALEDTEPEEAIMIGDDVRDDIRGAQAIGMRGFLVKTGKYREGDETKITPSPAAVVSDFSEAVDLILKSTY